jgi:hypothetical protein
MDDLIIGKLRDEIEDLRDELHNIALRKGINSPGAIRASQLLDIKVNEFYCHQKQKNAHFNKL